MHLVRDLEIGSFLMSFTISLDIILYHIPILLIIALFVRSTLLMLTCKGG